MAICKACQSMDISCSGCIFDDYFSQPDEILDLKKLVREFSYNGFKVRLAQIISEGMSVSCAIASIEEKIASIKEKCIKYKNECKSMGYTISDPMSSSDPISSADIEIYDLIESGNEKYRYLATAPDSVAPGSGTYRVVRATGTSAGGISSSGVSAANGLSVGGPSVGLLSVAPAAAVCGQRSTRPRPCVPRTCGRVVDLDAGQEEVDAVLEDVSSASEEDLKDPDYNPGGDSN